MALTDKLTAIGNAIREKTGGTDLLTLDQMPTEISNIQGGGTVEALTITSNGTYNPPTGIDGYAPVVVNVPQDGGPPESAFTFTGDCEGLFREGNWDWFLDRYGSKITMNNITGLKNCFAGCKLATTKISSISADASSSLYLNGMFSGSELEEFPRIILKSIYYAPYMKDLFSSCERLRELPYDYFTSMTDNWETANSMEYNGDKNSLFTNCYSLREHPDMTCLAQTGDYISYYSNTFYNCASLNEVINYPVAPGNSITDNRFYDFVSHCYRLKNMKFKTNEDGTPITANWTYQTIDLTKYVGYAGDYYYNIYRYNSGITLDKRVSDDATYQALKDDPDYWTSNINYSRYNHNSAVNTINSLPDTSAYLATAGGTNTIKFKGESGASTDGGAINTLTEEEIAVATAKGWTVSLV